MQTPLTRTKLILIALLIFLLTGCFSVVITVFAAQNVNLNGTISIEYQPPITVLDTSHFSISYPQAKTCVVDYAENYTDIINDENFSEKFVDTNDLGLEAGGISLFYNSSTKEMYILSHKEIYAHQYFRNFSNMTNLTSIEFYNMNTSNVTSLGNYSNASQEPIALFSNCQSLTKIIGMDKWDTSNVTSMEYLFYNCWNLEYIDISGWDTSKVTNTHCMFLVEYRSIGTYGLTKAIYVGEKWNMENVTESTYMFGGQSKLYGGNGYHRTIDEQESYSAYREANVAVIDTAEKDGYLTGVTYLDSVGIGFANHIPDSCTSVEFEYTENAGFGPTDGKVGLYYDYINKKLRVLSNETIMAAESCKNMFYQKSNLTSIKFNNFDTINVTNMENMFVNCSGLTELDVSSFNTSKVTIMEGMFTHCNLLTSIGGFTTDTISDNWNTEKVTNMRYMFSNCSSLTELDVSGLETGAVTNMGSMFIDCSKLTSIGGFTTDTVSDNWNTEKVTNMDHMFSGCSSLTELDVSGLATGEVTDMSYMFYRCLKLTSLDVTNFNTSNVTNMLYMFHACISLTSLDVTNFNTSKVTSMAYMFSGCSKLTSLDVTNFNTNQVKNMGGMFNDCSGLTSLDVSGFETNNVTGMHSMFSGCSGLTSLDVTNFNTCNVTAMSDMFADCSKLTSLDLSNFNTSSVTDMSGMFDTCLGLTSLDLSSFDTSSVTVIRWMFEMCSNLKTIYVGDKWIISSDIYYDDRMFHECTSLVGGAGTTVSLTDSTYAIIDGSDPDGDGTPNPGYLTGVTYLDSVGSGFANYIPDSCTSVEFEYASTLGLGSTNGKIALINKGTTLYVVSNLDIKPTDCSSMFSNKSNLTSITFNNFNTSSVTSMSYMFYGCSSLTSLDLSNFNTRLVTNMTNMFSSCQGLITIYVGDNWNTASVTSSEDMFKGCTRLVGGYGTAYDLSKVDATYARLDTLFEKGYFSSKDPNYGPPDFEPPYVGSSNNEDWEVMTLVEELINEYYGDVNSIVFDVVNSPDTAISIEGVFVEGHTIYAIGETPIVFPEDCSRRFANLPDCITQLSFINVDTSNVTNMDYMFYNCQGLIVLDLSGFDTFNVTSTIGMFAECYYLEHIYASELWMNGYWDTETHTSWIYNSYKMFDHCVSLYGRQSCLRIDELGTSGYYAILDMCYVYESTEEYVPGLLTYKYYYE